MTLLLRPGRAVVTALLLAIAASACASSGGSGSEGNIMRAGEGPWEGTVRLTVENNDFRDATIYAYWNGAKERVGMVTGKTSETLEMTWRNDRIQLEVDFVGGGGFRSDEMEVYQGDHLNFVILPGR